MPSQRKSVKGKQPKSKAGTSSQRTLFDVLQPSQPVLSQESDNSLSSSQQSLPVPPASATRRENIPEERELNTDCHETGNINRIREHAEPPLLSDEARMDVDLNAVVAGNRSLAASQTELPPSSPLSAPVPSIIELETDSEVMTADNRSDGGLPPSSPLSAPLPFTPSSSPKLPEKSLLPATPTKPVHWFFSKRPKPAKAPEQIEVLGDDEEPRLPFILTTSATPPTRTASDSLQDNVVAPTHLGRGFSFDNPILVESSPVKSPIGGYRDVSRSPSLAAFTRQTNNCDVDADSIRLEPSSPVQPIRAASHTPPSPARPIHPLFALKATRAPTPSSRKKFKSNEGDDAPYPNAESQHVNAPTCAHPATPNPVGLRGSRTRTTMSDMIGSESESFSLSRSDTNAPDLDPLLPSPAGARVTTCTTTEQKQAYLGSIPPAHESAHPVIRRLADALRTNVCPSPTSAPQRQWSDRWRPVRAAEVLGNEQSALYLRDWLRALALQLVADPALQSPEMASQESNGKKSRKGNGGKSKFSDRGMKRPRVVRAVERSKRKKRRIDSDDEDSWIVYSDDEDEGILADELPDEEEEPDLPGRPRLVQKGASPRSSPPPPTAPPPNEFENYLTNTILLTGPPGSGKTAAVYACAEELGWEVFEVYPGIGKRNAANLDNLVGEVGKNHLVRKTVHRGQGSGAADKTGLGIFFGKKKARKVVIDDDDVEESAGQMQRGDFGFITTPGSQTTDGVAGVRQSIVLLEEVDILFKEDANFWTAVTNFIKECKRPVICTCNDASLVPLADLPLQRNLEFSSPSTAVATSYLQVLCCAEGFAVERDALARLYETTHIVDDVDVPELPVNIWAKVFPESDLRRAINVLQLWCPGSEPQGRTVSEGQWAGIGNPLEELMHAGCKMGRAKDVACEQTFYAEFLSFTDSYLLRRPVDTREALWLNTVERMDEDLVGHSELVEGKVPGLYDGDEMIAETAIRQARGMFMAGGVASAIVGRTMFRPRELFRSRVVHQARLVAVLDAMMPMSRTGAPKSRAALCMDYLPWMRAMLAADDVAEAAAHALQVSSGGRQTRNSLGGAYVRTINVSGSVRELLSGSGFK